MRMSGETRSLAFGWAAFLCLIISAISLQNLYNPKRHGFSMELLNITNFNTTVYNRPNAWLIQFYNVWCGHCQNFVSTWVHLSTDVIDWNHTIKLGVINCAQDFNRPICRRYRVKGYPTIKLFGPHMKADDLGEGLLRKTVTEFEDGIIRFLVKETTAGRDSDAWVNLQDYEGDIDAIFDDKVPAKAEDAVLIVDKASSRVAHQVILDLGNHRRVYVRKVLSDSDTVKDYNFTSELAVIMVDREGNIDPFPDPPTERKALISFIFEELDIRSKLHTAKATIGMGATTTTFAPVVNPREDEVYMVDIENALQYAFRQEVSLHQEIDSKALAALEKFVDALVKYLPTRPQVNKFLVGMKEYLETKDVLTGEEFEEELKNLTSQTAKLPAQQSWKGCQGSSAKYRGYPCGLWTTFHALTVNAVLRAGNDSSYSALEVMRAIHGYVKYFFGCQSCSQHFQRMYAEDAEEFVKEPNDEIEWLWNGHNKVNKRLSGDTTEDPAHPKQQFPIKDKCEICYNSDDSFNVPEVIDYLKEIYSQSMISLSGTQSLSSEHHSNDA